VPTRNIKPWAGSAKSSGPSGVGGNREVQKGTGKSTKPYWPEKTGDHSTLVGVSTKGRSQPATPEIPLDPGGGTNVQELLRKGPDQAWGNAALAKHPKKKGRRKDHNRSEPG